MVLISINLKRTRISDFQFYSNEDQAILNLFSADWVSPKKLKVPGTHGQKLCFNFAICIYILTIHLAFQSCLQVLFSFQRKTHFFRLLLKVSSQGNCFHFWEHVLSKKDSHTLQTPQFLFISQKNCQLTKSVTSSGISAHGVYICSHKSYVLKTCCILRLWKLN